MRTVTARLLGLVLILLGAWGGIVAYAGPRIGYRMDSAGAWDWTTSRWELHAAPGAAVVLGGLLLMVAAPRIIARFGAMLAVLGGIWLVVGPLFASMWLGSAAETRVASSSLMDAARPLGYHYGTGVLIVAVAAYAWAICSTVVRAVAYPTGPRHRVDEDSTVDSMTANE
jgi:hypothetical protein